MLRVTYLQLSSALIETANDNTLIYTVNNQILELSHVANIEFIFQSFVRYYLRKIIRPTLEGLIVAKICVLCSQQP